MYSHWSLLGNEVGERRCHGYHRPGPIAFLFVCSAACTQASSPSYNGDTGTTTVVSALTDGGTDAGAVHQPGFLPVYNVTDYGVTTASSCIGTNADDVNNTAALQAVVDTAHMNGGGIVYFPPGRYCVTDEIKGYESITLMGAAMAGMDNGSATTIYTSSDFGSNKAVIRLANRTGTNVQNSGFSVHNLNIQIYSTSPGIVGVDFSGTWFGSIRGVAVLGQCTATPAPSSTGSIGFLFSDGDILNPGTPGACFGNLVERTSVACVTTGYKFESAYLNATLNTVTSFWAVQVVNGVWTAAAGQVGVSLRDGYMGTSFSSSTKAFKHTAGFPYISTANIQTEGFSKSDLPIGGGIASLTGGGLGPAAYLDGDVAGVNFKHILRAPDGVDCGVHKSAPCPSTGGYETKSQSLSFWADIPAGTHLVAGANTFSFLTTVGVDSNLSMGDPYDDLYFAFHVVNDGGLNQPLSFSANTVRQLIYGSLWLTYVVKLYVTSEVASTSGPIVFFLEANTTVPATKPTP
jgi:hypothetical protein